MPGGFLPGRNRKGGITQTGESGREGNELQRPVGDGRGRGPCMPAKGVCLLL